MKKHAIKNILSFHANVFWYRIVEWNVQNGFSNDLVPTASSISNNQMAVNGQTFSTYHSFKNHGYHCSGVRISNLTQNSSCNYYLKKIIAIIDDYCTFCKEESETMQHVFDIVSIFYHCGVNAVCTF